MDGLLELDAVDLSALLARRQVGAAEVMAATLARIAAVNPGVNAIVNLADPDALMAQARAADAAPSKGWLHGMPIAIKDLADAAGFPTTQGTPLFRDAVATHDAVMVARLRAAGAIVIGKTNVPEFGLGSHTFNPVFGPTRNPYDRTRSAGGSSGGAAVALATGMIAVADGSDMMGSLRNPAGWTNTYGMRPTWGLVPSEPEGDTFLHQLATLGPMGRSPRDVAALLETMSGPDPRQPHGLPVFRGQPLDRDLRGLRIGWLGDWGGAYATEAGILTTCQGALSVLGALGCDVRSVPPPFPAAALWDAWITLRSWAVAAGLGPLYADPATRAALKPEAVWEIERGLALSALEVHRASVIRSRWFSTAAALFDQFDALILPSAQVWPFDIDLHWPQTIGSRRMDTYHRWMEVVIPVSLIGLPCLCIPAGFGPQGLPIGLQLFGPRGADLRLLQIGQGWHQAAPWAGRRP